MTLKKILYGFGILAIILTLIPFIPADFWWIRMFDFPHIQLTTLTFLAILTFYIKFDFWNKTDFLFLILLIVCFVFQFSKIIAYTPLFDKEVMDTTNKIPERSVKLLTANVLQKNENDSRLVEIIRELDADIMIFTEANHRWKDAIVKNLSSEYAYKLEMPLENTYGILMYSKFELIEPEIKFLVTDTIPSIDSKFRLPSGDIVQLLAVHPTPPMPQENILSTDRDAELMLASRLARESAIPVIVIGDFNDIPWSSTTTLFQSTSELLDIRVGRGFYNTYNSKKYLLRWPLDHIYVSPEFRLNTMKSCESIDSDHFPYYVELSYEPEGASEQMPKIATKEQLEKAEKQLRKLKEKKTS